MLDELLPLWSLEELLLDCDWAIAIPDNRSPVASIATCIFIGHLSSGIEIPV
jgi:hypothetical protein